MVATSFIRLLSILAVSSFILGLPIPARRRDFDTGIDGSDDIIQDGNNGDDWSGTSGSDWDSPSSDPNSFDNSSPFTDGSSSDSGSDSNSESVSISTAEISFAADLSIDIDQILALVQSSSSMLTPIATYKTGHGEDGGPREEVQVYELDVPDADVNSGDDNSDSDSTSNSVDSTSNSTSSDSSSDSNSDSSSNSDSDSSSDDASGAIYVVVADMDVHESKGSDQLERKRRMTRRMARRRMARKRIVDFDSTDSTSPSGDSDSISDSSSSSDSDSDSEDQLPSFFLPKSFVEQYNLQQNSLGAIVCGNNMFYAVLGESVFSGETIGEASSVLAQACFPDEGLGGDNGHGKSDVTYIIFNSDGSDSDSTSMESVPISTSMLALKERGDRKMRSFLGGMNSGSESNSR